MSYRPGRYRAGGRHEDKEEVKRRRALRYGGLGRKKEEVRTGFDLDFGERQKAAAHTGVCQRRNVRNSVLGLDRKPLIFENQNRIRSCAAWQSRGAFSILVLVWALSGASVRMGISGVRRSSFAAGASSQQGSGKGKATNKRMNIKCSHCGTDYEVEEKDMYRYTKCEVCGKGFVIGATKSLQKVDGGGCEEEKQKKMPTLGIRRPPHQTSHQNIRYEELVAMNHVAYEQRKKKECQAALIKYSVYAVLLVVCCTGSYIVWNKYESRKKRESALAAEEARRIEEAACRKAEERRKAAEEAARKRIEEKLALERKLDEERLAREKQREEERLAWERKCESERLARERERQEREEKLAADRRRKEEERKAAQQAREAKRLLDERKREEERLAKDVESRRQQESQEKSYVIEERRVYVGKTPQTVSKQSSVDKKYEFDFFAARRGMGGSVLEALVRKLNGSITDDKMSHTSARTARATAMMSIAGAIGPIEYERQIRTKKTTSMQAIGGFDGYVGGEVVSGTVYGPVSSIKTKVGGYVAKVPTGFRKAFDQMMSVARRGHSRANAEAGACIFVDATFVHQYGCVC